MTDWKALVPGPYTEIVPQVQNALVTAQAGLGFIFLSDYSDLEAAITDIGSDRATLLIDTLAAVANNLTIPANVTLFLTNTGGIQPASTKTVTIKGPLIAPPVQIFYGPGTVSLAENVFVSELQAAWFACSGAKLSTGISSTFTTTSGSTAAGATSVTPFNQTFTAAAATDIITATAHPFVDGSIVRVSNSGGALPAPLAAGTDYYVRDKTANTFKLAATSGGAAINLTTDGTGTQTVFSATFANGDVIKITGAGVSGAVYRGVITAGGGTTIWTIYPKTITTVSSGSPIHHGDNNVTTKTSGSVSAAATAIPVTDASTFSASQGVYIAGAGAASGSGFLPFIGTISSVVGNTINLTSGITTGVTANALVMHDDTLAIRAAIAAAATVKTIKVKFHRGVFMVNAAPTGAQDCRIQLPAIANVNDLLSLVIEGEPVTLPTCPAFLANFEVTTQGTIIQSDGAGGCIFGGDSAGSFTSIDARFKDLTIRTYDNPKIIGINGRAFIFMSIDYCMFDTASQPSALTQPTDTTNRAVYTPMTANGGRVTIRNTWAIGGWYAGFNLSEHAIIEGDVVSFANYYGVLLDSAIHPVFLNRLQVSECTRSVGVLSALRYSGTLVLERRWSTASIPAWLNTEWDIYDPSNYGSGQIAYHINEGFTNSLAKPFLVNGAIELMYYPLSTGNPNNFGIPFSDNFDDNLTETSWWTIGSQAGVTGVARGTVLEQNNRVEIAPQASVTGVRYRGYVTKDTFNLFNRTVKVKVPQITTNGAVTSLVIQLNATNRYAILAFSTTIMFQVIHQGAATTIGTTTYNATNHLWWRIVHAGDQVITADVSADGSSWTNLGTDTGFRMYFNRMRVSLEAGTESSIATPGTAFFDDFSIT